MDERDWLAQRFEEHRTRLRAVAYRMLGSLSEADDAVQEAWLRLNRTDASGVDNLGGWLTTVVARIALNMLRSRKTRREEPLAVRLPGPVVDRANGLDPEHEALCPARPRRPAGADQRRGRGGRLPPRAAVLDRRRDRPERQIVEIDFLADKERLRQLDLTTLDD